MKVAEAAEYMTKAWFAAMENDVFERVAAFERQVLDSGRRTQPTMGAAAHAFA